MSQSPVSNPLSMAARGKIYVASIVTGAVGLVAGAVLTVVELPQWGIVVTAVVSATAIAASALARDNLNEGEDNAR